MEETFHNVRFQLDVHDWHGRAKEDLWATLILGTESNGLFRLRSTPFFTTLVSKMDTVRAIRSNDGEHFDFVRVDRVGGHSTYMMLAKPDQTGFDEYMQKLVALKCEFEATKIKISLGERILFSIDVPPTTDIYQVYSVLEDAEKAGVLMFQEGHVGHQLKA